MYCGIETDGPLITRTPETNMGILFKALPSKGDLICLSTGSARCVAGDGAGSNPLYAEQLYGKTPSFHGLGRAGAKLRDISMSEKKLNYFAKLIRRMHVDDALAQCSLQPKKAAGICAKVHKMPLLTLGYERFLAYSEICIDEQDAWVDQLASHCH